MFSISIYSSEVIHMDKAEMECVDTKLADGSDWHFDCCPSYTCDYHKSYFTTEGECTQWTYYTGEGMNANTACTWCGGGTCTATPITGSRSGTYEYSKPTYFHTS